MPGAVRRERIWYWDILRIAAVLCLVIRHISTACFDFVEPLGFRWWVFNSYGSLVAWMVPVYLMLSGAWFLNPETKVTVGSLWRKNILRMLVAFAVWSVLYTAYNLISGQDRVAPPSASNERERTVSSGTSTRMKASEIKMEMQKTAATEKKAPTTMRAVRFSRFPLRLFTESRFCMRFLCARLTFFSIFRKDTGS